MSIVFQSIFTIIWSDHAGKETNHTTNVSTLHIEHEEIGVEHNHRKQDNNGQ